VVEDACGRARPGARRSTAEGGAVTTRTIAVIALVIAVVVLILLLI
jgi:hypothetical protein